eukprot:3932096-Rhodomonas_salina.1
MPLLPGLAPSTQAPTGAFPSRSSRSGCACPLGVPLLHLRAWQQLECCAVASARPCAMLLDTTPRPACATLCIPQGARGPASRLEGALRVCRRPGDDPAFQAATAGPHGRGLSRRHQVGPADTEGHGSGWGQLCPTSVRGQGASPSHGAHTSLGSSRSASMLVGATLGRLGADAVTMSWGLAHRAAEKTFIAKGLDTVSPTTGKYSHQFLQLRSRFRHRNITRLSLALCRAGGSRGLPARAQHYRAAADLLAALEVASSSRHRS